MKKISKKSLFVILGLVVIAMAVVVIVSMSLKTNENSKKSRNPIVTYYTEDGRVFAQEEITTEIMPLPQIGAPEIAGKVFIGWDKDISTAAQNKITAISAKHLDVSNDVNVFALPTIYGTNYDMVQLPFKLMGKVDMCAADIIISYDTNALEFVNCENTDAAVTVNNDTEAGLIYLRFVCAENITGEVDLTTFIFEFKSDSIDETDVKVSVREIAKLNDNNELTEVDYGVVDSKVHILPFDDAKGR